MVLCYYVFIQLYLGHVGTDYQKQKNMWNLQFGDAIDSKDLDYLHKEQSALYLELNIKAENLEMNPGWARFDCGQLQYLII
mgnify:FL=1